MKRINPEKIPRLAPSTFGYSFGLAQPAAPLALGLNWPEQADLKLVDEWLKLFISDSSGYDCEILERDEIVPDDIYKLLCRILILGAYLCRTIGVAVFQTGKIIKIEAATEPGRWLAQVAIPVSDNISSMIFEETYESASSIIYRMSALPPKDNGPQKAYEMIEQYFVMPMVSVIRRNKSVVPVLLAAGEAGVPFRHIASNCYQLGWGKKARLIRGSVLDSDSNLGSMLSHNKYMASVLMRDAGLPTPLPEIVNSKKAAIDIAGQIGWPVVVKPNMGSMGKGVSIDIQDEQQLLTALSKARKIHEQVIVERQVPGVCCRIFVHDGEVLFVSKRNPISVKGDGVHTVKDLIEINNSKLMMDPPWNRDMLCPSDDFAEQCMQAAGYDFNSVPDEGELVPLRKFESTQSGGYFEDATEIAHPANKDIAARAASLFRLSNAGIDIITPDISKPWYENGAAINEVNSAPFLGIGETSKKRLPKFFAEYIDGDGRIPVEVYIGGDDALEHAKKRCQELNQNTAEFFLVNHEQILSPTGDRLYLDASGLFFNCVAMLKHKDVGGLVVVIQSDELLQRGLPFDRVEKYEVLSDNLQTSGDVDNKTVVTRLTQLLDAYMK